MIEELPVSCAVGAAVAGTTTPTLSCSALNPFHLFLVGRRAIEKNSFLITTVNQGSPPVDGRP